MKISHPLKFRFYTILILTCSLLFVQCNLEDKKVQEMLEKDVQQANTLCPKMEDPITRHDSCVALPGRIFQYSYTLMEVNDSLLADFKRSGIPNVKTRVKTDPLFETYRACNVTIRCVYNDTLKNEIFRFDVTPKDYNE